MQGKDLSMDFELRQAREKLEREQRERMQRAKAKAEHEREGNAEAARRRKRSRHPTALGNALATPGAILDRAWRGFMV